MPIKSEMGVGGWDWRTDPDLEDLLARYSRDAVNPYAGVQNAPGPYTGVMQPIPNVANPGSIFGTDPSVHMISSESADIRSIPSRLLPTGRTSNNDLNSEVAMDPIAMNWKGGPIPTGNDSGWETVSTPKAKDKGGWETLSQPKDESKGWETVQPSNQQQPYFKGDPTADIVNTLKDVGTAAGSNPRQAAEGGAASIAGMIGQGGYLAGQLLGGNYDTFVKNGHLDLPGALQEAGEFSDKVTKFFNPAVDPITGKPRADITQTPAFKAGERIPGLPIEPVMKGFDLTGEGVSWIAEKLGVSHETAQLIGTNLAAAGKIGTMLAPFLAKGKPGDTSRIASPELTDLAREDRLPPALTPEAAQAANKQTLEAFQNKVVRNPPEPPKSMSETTLEQFRLRLEQAAAEEGAPKGTTEQAPATPADLLDKVQGPDTSQETEVGGMSQKLFVPKNQRGIINPDAFGINNAGQWVRDKLDNLDVPDKIAELKRMFSGIISPTTLDRVLADASDPTSRRTIAVMSPDQFLQAAQDRHAIDPQYASSALEEKRSLARQYLNVQTPEAGRYEMPFLMLDERNGVTSVVGHEGRHLMDVLKERGVKAVPVQLMHESRRWGDPNWERPTFVKKQGENTAVNNFPDSAIFPQRTAKLPTYDVQELPADTSLAKGPLANQRGGPAPTPAPAPADLSPTAKQILGNTPQERTMFEKAKLILARDRRTAEEFIKQMPIATKDIAKRLGAATGSFRTLTELKRFINDPTHAIHTLNFLSDAMHVAKEEYERIIIDKIYPHTKEFMDYYGTSTAMGFGRMYKTLKTDVPIARWFEKNSDQWFDGKNYSPTKEQLMAKGMSPESADAWGHMYQGFENAWPSLLEFAQRKGIHAPDRVPGYLPHFVMGPWKVRLFRDKGDGTNSYFATAGANSAKAAEVLQKNMQRLIDPKNPDHEGLQVQIVGPSSHNDLAGMISGLFEAKDIVQKNKGLSALVDKLYEQASVGRLASALERQSKPQLLHQFDRIGRGDDFELTPAQARASLIKMKELMEAIPAMNMRAKFVTEKLFPLETAGYFEKLPNMRTAAEEYMKQFLHIPDTAAGHIDGWIQDFFIRNGMNPGLPGKVIDSLTGWTAKYYLFYSPKFWAVQALQKLQGLGVLWTAKSELNRMGLDASVTKALMESFKPTEKLSSGETLKDYTLKTGHATPYYVENLDTSKLFQDPIAKRIEMFTRQGGMKNAYGLFKQVFDEQTALDAAGKMTDMINVPYSSELGKPFFFSKEGRYFKTFSIFLQYPLHMLQMIKDQWTTLAESKGNFKAQANAAMGLAYTGAAMYAIGGIAGLPFVNNYDQLARWLNLKFGTHMPLSVELVRGLGKLMREHNFGDDFSNMVAKSGEFGAISSALGYDMSRSAQGPNFQLPEVFMHFLSSFGGLAVMSLQYEKEGMSRKTMGQYISELPPMIRGTAEYFLKTDNPSYADLVKRLQGETKDWAPSHADITEKGNYQRNPMDTFMALLGFKSLGEAASNNTYTIFNHQLQTDQEAMKRRQQQINENPYNPQTGGWIKEMLNRLGKDPGAAISEAIQHQQDKQLTEDQRKALRAGTLEGANQYKRWETIRKSEPRP